MLFAAALEVGTEALLVVVVGARVVLAVPDDAWLWLVVAVVVAAEDDLAVVLAEAVVEVVAEAVVEVVAADVEVAVAVLLMVLLVSSPQFKPCYY